MSDYQYCIRNQFCTLGLDAKEYGPTVYINGLAFFPFRGSILDKDDKLVESKLYYFIHDQVTGKFMAKLIQDEEGVWGVHFEKGEADLKSEQVSFSVMSRKASQQLIEICQ
tara:strand:- start:83 stop:415 length:333 start_codon:yes stop_codon:yes gene_type:complete